MKRLLAIVALSCSFAQAQTVSPILQPHVTYVNGSGAPCTGCKLYSYYAGSTTPLATYKDSTGIVTNTNPVILDVAGGANVWTFTGPYKFTLTDAGGSVIWTVDNVQGIPKDTVARAAAAAAQATASAALPAFGMTGSHGTGAYVQHSDGTGTSGNCARFAADGSITNSGTPCATPIANVQITTGTGAVSATTCTSPTATTMTGVATTSAVISPTPTTDTSAVTGWGSSGGLVFIYWVTANTFNWRVCNPTASSITPGGSVTWNVGAR